VSSLVVGKNILATFGSDGSKPFVAVFNFFGLHVVCAKNPVIRQLHFYLIQKTRKMDKKKK